MKNIKVILFDIDGMVVDSLRVSDLLEKEYGISNEQTCPFFKNEFQECLVGKADLKEELAKYVTEWGWSGSVDDLLTLWFAEERNVIEERFEPVVQMLRKSGLNCYLATNNEKYRTENLVHHRHLGEWFDGVFSSAYLGVKKPDAAFFEKIEEALAVPRESMLFWDDDPENIEGAKAFGMQTERYLSFDDFTKKMKVL